MEGIVTNEEVAKTTPCTCWAVKYTPKEKSGFICTSKGIQRFLSDRQERIYCKRGRKIKPMTPEVIQQVKHEMTSLDQCITESAHKVTDDIRQCLLSQHQKTPSKIQLHV